MKDDCSNEENDKKEYLDIQDVRSTSVSKNNRAVMINKAHFEYGLRSAKNLDKMKHNTGSMTDYKRYNISWKSRKGKTFSKKT